VEEGTRFGNAVERRQSAPTLWSIGRARLEALLGTIAPQGEHFPLLRAFDAMTPWARRRSLTTTDYRSGIADDGAPLEFCVTFSTKRHPEIQVYAEPLGDPPSTITNARQAHQVLRHLATSHDLHLERLMQVKDIVFPAQPWGAFALWLGASWAEGRPLLFKCYVNPQVSGETAAVPVTTDVLTRLGFGAAWGAVAETLLDGQPRRDELSLISFDLLPPPHARVKVYVRHHQATVSDLDRRIELARDYQRGDAERFYRCLYDDTRFSLRPPIVELAFVDPQSPQPASWTLEFPIGSYVRDDLEASQRIQLCLKEFDIDPALYQHALSAFCPRALSECRGVQSHVTLRRVDGEPRVAVYLASQART